MTYKESSALPFAPWAEGNGLIFVSGTIGRHPETGEISGDVGRQTEQSLETIAQRLSDAGSTLRRVVKATIYLTNICDFDAMNRAYRAFFPASPPARSCIAVVALPDAEARVEIEVIALQGGDEDG